MLRPPVPRIRSVLVSVALTSTLTATMAATMAGCGTQGPPVAVSAPADATASAPTVARPKPRLFVIGDSYVEGTEQNTGPEFPALAARMLGWRVRSDGVGSTGYLSNLAGRPNYYHRIGPDLATTNPGFLVVAGGANDRDLPLAQVMVRARDFFDIVHRMRPWARVVVISPWVPQADTYRPKLDTALRRLTRRVGGTWIDTHSWFTDRPQLIGPDYDHPNDAGHRYIARRLAAVLRQVERADP